MSVLRSSVRVSAKDRFLRRKVFGSPLLDTLGYLSRGEESDERN